MCTFSVGIVAMVRFQAVPCDPEPVRMTAVIVVPVTTAPTKGMPCPPPPELRPMQARDVHQPHRVATSLELLFDLVTVIAVASAAAGLHHAIAGGHATDGVVRFAMAFFGIWWAWMNYTWFASAYDNDDVLFRLLTLAIMGGALAIASGIELFFKSLDLTMVVTGYLIMRVGMVVLWLRAARGDPARRTTALTYALGIALVQVYWAGLLWLGCLIALNSSSLC